jgi:hypothetical protein
MAEIQFFTRRADRNFQVGARPQIDRIAPRAYT